MPRKNVKPNGYALFARQIQVQSQWKISQDEAFAKAEPLWEVLSGEAKQRWKELAKSQRPSQEERAKRPRKIDVRSGINVEKQARKPLQYYDIRNGSDSFGKKRERDRQDLSNYLEWAAPSTAEEGRIAWLRDEKDYHILTVIPYFEKEDYSIVPAEVAVVGFNFGRGIIDTKHWILTLAEVPRNSRLKAQANQRSKNAESGHGIPVVSKEESEHLGFYSSHGHVMGKISEAVRKDRYVFVPRKQYNHAQAAINWLKNVQLEQTRLRLKSKWPSLTVDMSKSFPPERVRCVEDLAVSMVWLCGVDISRAVKADVIDAHLDSAKYNGLVNLACPYHRSIENWNCAMVEAKRTLCWMFEELKEPCHISVTSQHLPTGIVREYPGLTAVKLEETEEVAEEESIGANSDLESRPLIRSSVMLIRKNLLPDLEELVEIGTRDDSEKADSGKNLNLASEAEDENVQELKIKLKEPKKDEPTVVKNKLTFVRGKFSTPYGNYLASMEQLKRIHGTSKGEEERVYHPGLNGFGRGRPVIKS